MRLAMALVLLTMSAGCATGGAAVAPFEVLGLPLGLAREEVEQRLKGSAVMVLERGAGTLSIEGPMIETAFQTQRALLHFDEDRRLDRIHIRIIPDTSSGGADLLRLYRDVRHRLIKRMGPPSFERSEGDAPERSLLREIQNGAVVRLIQWDDGRTVRAGIPRRVDGNLAVEILVTSHRLSRSDELWSEVTLR